VLTTQNNTIPQPVPADPAGTGLCGVALSNSREFAGLARVRGRRRSVRDMFRGPVALLPDVNGPAALLLTGLGSTEGPGEDAGLWRLIAGGEEITAAPEHVAWDELIERHGRRVVVSLLARGLPLERAKELADDAWVRIIQQHRGGRLKELRVPGLVIVQALWMMRDDRRRTMRREALGAAGMRDPSALAEHDVEERLLAREQLRQVIKVVEGAPPTARRVFELTYGEPPRTASEVAEVLGISVQRVRQVACELRKRIRAALGGSIDG
jgi:RNA polymerase sigma-70 factor (ECF subfamily)